MDVRKTASESASERNSAEAMRSERLFLELEELSKCRAAVCNEVDLSELPDLEEVDAREMLREEIMMERLAVSGHPPSTDTVDCELDVSD